jgi:mannose-1-phosphate guanylyltransferase
MFFWRLSTFLRELDRAAPAFGHAVRSMARDMAQRDRAAVEAVFEALPDISIDYALMEKARRVLMARGDFPWDDIGAWDSLARGLPADEAGNVAVGNPLVLDSRGCVVYNAAGARRMAVAVLGCRDLVVVARQDSVLVLPRARSQEVKRVVAELRRRGASQV